MEATANTYGGASDGIPNADVSLDELVDAFNAGDITAENLNARLDGYSPADIATVLRQNPGVLQTAIINGSDGPFSANVIAEAFELAAEILGAGPENISTVLAEYAADLSAEGVLTPREALAVSGYAAQFIRSIRDDLPQGTLSALQAEVPASYPEIAEQLEVEPDIGDAAEVIGGVGDALDLIGEGVVSGLADGVGRIADAATILTETDPETEGLAGTAEVIGGVGDALDLIGEGVVSGLADGVGRIADAATILTETDPETEGLAGTDELIAGVSAALDFVGGRRGVANDVGQEPLSERNVATLVNVVERAIYGSLQDTEQPVETGTFTVDRILSNMLEGPEDSVSALVDDVKSIITSAWDSADTAVGALVDEIGALLEAAVTDPESDIGFKPPDYSADPRDEFSKRQQEFLNYTSSPEYEDEDIESRVASPAVSQQSPVIEPPIYGPLPASDLDVDEFVSSIRAGVFTILQDPSLSAQDAITRIAGVLPKSLQGADGAVEAVVDEVRSFLTDAQIGENSSAGFLATGVGSIVRTALTDPEGNVSISPTVVAPAAPPPIDSEIGIEQPFPGPLFNPNPVVPDPVSSPVDTELAPDFDGLPGQSVDEEYAEYTALRDSANALVDVATQAVENTLQNPERTTEDMLAEIRTAVTELVGGSEEEVQALMDIIGNSFAEFWDGTPQTQTFADALVDKLEFDIWDNVVGTEGQAFTSSVEFDASGRLLSNSGNLRGAIRPPDAELQAAASAIASNPTTTSAIIEAFSMAGEVLGPDFQELAVILSEVETAGDGFRAVAEYIGDNPQGLDQITQSFSTAAGIVSDLLDGMGIAPDVAESISNGLSAAGEYLNLNNTNTQEAQMFFEILGQAADATNGGPTPSDDIMGPLAADEMPADSELSGNAPAAEMVYQFPGVVPELPTPS